MAGLYRPGIPHDIEPEHESILAAFQATAALNPAKTALQRFDASGVKDDPISQLERLGRLRESGLLTDAECEAARARLARQLTEGS